MSGDNMPKYNIDKMRSAGLRYLVVDKDGQAWAFETKPQRKYGCYWILSDDLLPPQKSNERKLYWCNMLYWHSKGREICMPVFDIPVELEWEDEPYDIVANMLVRKEDFHTWPPFDSILW